MDILVLYNNAKKELDEFIAKHERIRANYQADKQRKGHIDLLDDMSKCRGKLGVSRTKFLLCIQEQSKAIREGMKEGFDTHVQEKTLKEAAIGYLLVRDAIFALESVNSYDSVEHANELLAEAIGVMTGKQRPRDRLFFGGQRKRDAYGFINSSAALREKDDMVESFFMELKMTGDIDQCIEAYNNRRKSDVNVTQGSETTDQLLDQLHGKSSDEYDLDNVDVDALFNPNTPSDS